MNLSFNKRYFDGEVSHGFISLFTGKTIVFIASGLLGLFLPIFLYNLFKENFRLVVLYYGLGYLFYGFLMVWGARLLSRFGFRRSLRYSVFLGALFYLIFYFVNDNNFIYLIPLSVLVIVFFRLLYWIPYHVDFAKFTDSKNRAREISILFAASLVISIIIPVLAGFIITRFGYDALFIMVIILFLVSGIPYLTIPRTQEKFEWSFKKTFNYFFSKQKRKMILAYMAEGAENVVGLIVWPIFIFQLLNRNYLEVGVVSTLIVGVTVLMQLFLGKYIDKNKKERILHIGSALYSLGWVFKIFIATAFQIFIVGTYHNLAKIFITTPFEALTYDIAADNGHYVDEFTVLREMAVQLGKVLMVIFVIIVSFFAAIQWTFVLAAVAALLLNLLRAKDAQLLPRV